MATVSIVFGIISIIISTLSIVGSGSSEIIFLMLNLLVYGAPTSSVVGVITGIIANVRKGDAVQKKKARIGLLCSIIGVILCIVAWIMIGNIVSTWEIS